MRRISSALYLGLMLCAATWAGAARAADEAQNAGECKQLLEVANKELDAAKAGSAAGAAFVTEAASLLGAAKIQQQFAKYPNCIDKAKRARSLLKRAATTN